MATNKERIENLEVQLGGIQSSLNRVETEVADKLHQLENTINKLSEVILSSRTSTPIQEPEMHSSSSGLRNVREDIRDNSERGRPSFSSKLAKLEFPRFSGDDPTEWFTRAGQFFEYQNISDAQKVPLASFHLEGEANQWWQWLKRAYKEENKEVTWDMFQEELWARFGPTDGENFDEALSKIEQTGSLREYQKEFERLGNKVQGWSQKALVGTFMGGLNPEIADGIRMFKPKMLKEAISLARMRDEQLTRQKKAFRFSNQLSDESIMPPKSKTALEFKKLPWDEMQKRRAQGLCFNCNERFTPTHKCQGPQVLLLEVGEEAVEDDGSKNTEMQSKVSLRTIAGKIHEP